MPYLADTHIVIWALDEDKRLNRQMQQALRDDDDICYISQVSLWEIAIKSSIGKLKLKIAFGDYVKSIEESGFRLLELHVEDINTFHHLPVLHGDAFDRLLIAQALRRGLTMISADKEFTKYQVALLK
jgi:PIN domain nuclease of toxin-antitoxin system